MSKIKKTLLFFTPFHHLGRTAEQLKSTKANLAETARNAKALSQASQDATKEVLERVRATDDAKARFDIMYESHNWTDAELMQQIKAYSRARVATLVLLFVMFPALMLVLPQMPAMLAIFVVIVSVFLVVFCLAQVFRLALYECQLSERALYGWKDFGSRPDLFSRMLRFHSPAK